MIYIMNFGHSRRRNSINWIFPPPFDDYKHPLFQSRKPELPREQYYMEFDIRDSETCDFQDPSRFPAWIKFSDEEKVVHDCYGFRTWRIVSQRVKDKVEELEPGVHQFIPIRVLRKDGENLGGNYYIFNIRQKTFSIDADKSPYAQWTYRGDEYLPRQLYSLDLNLKAHPEKKRDPKGVHFVYRAGAVGNMVIWRERLEHNSPPNSGKRAWVALPDGTLRIKTISPETPEDLKSYRINNVGGIRVTEAFKTWAEQEKILGLFFEYPGCLDTEWKG